ncbi:MAG: GNAT family N-acetyltransferase [Thermoplasmata archaeon]
MIEEISKDEALAFFRTLGEERQTFTLTAKEVASSHIIIGERIGGKIVGIGGVRKRYGLPLSWIAVEKGHQDRGVGYRLLYRVNAIAANYHSFLLATIPKSNIGALRITEKNDYRICSEWKEIYYIIHPIDSLGEFLWRLLYRIFSFFPMLRKDSK